MKNAGIAFAFLIFAGFITTIIAMEWYPAALIRTPQASGGRAHIIWTYYVSRVTNSTLTYYKNALVSSSSTLAITPSITHDAREKSTDSIIENILIHNKIRAEGLETETEALITKKIAAYENQPNFTIAIALIYGLDSSEFVELVARPEAEREILALKNNWDDAALTAWVATEKKASRIVRF